MIYADFSIQNSDYPYIGGKAKNLHILKTRGFQIPDFIVVGSVCYEQFIRERNLYERIDAISKNITLATYSNYRDEIDHIREEMKIHEFSDPIKEKVLNTIRDKFQVGKRYSVRSSFGVEDGEHLSFAGMFDSFLNVEEDKVLYYIRECYQSLWTERAITYMLKNEVSIQEANPAVVIMEMIFAKKAGVAFSCNTMNGEQSEIVINANWGIGESVVNGQIEPDEYHLLNRGYQLKFKSRKTGSKKYMMQANYDSEGLEMVKVTRSDSVLSKKELYHLGWEVCRIRSSIGNEEQHQDIEWALDGKQLWILQARPITVLKEQMYQEIQSQVVWTNANMKEIMPGPHSYLSWSLLEKAFERMLNAINETIGFDYLCGVERKKLFQRHPYMNISVLQYEIYKTTGISPDVINKSIGGQQGSIRINNSITLRERVKQIKNLEKFYLAHKGISKELIVHQKHAFRRNTAEERISYHSLTNRELIKYLTKLLNQVENYAVNFEMLNMYSGFFVETYFTVCKFLYGKKVNVFMNSKMVQDSGLISAEYGKMLVAISNAIASRYETLDIAKIKKDFHVMRLVSEFLEKHGYRGMMEIDLLYERWEDNVDDLIVYAFKNKVNGDVKRKVQNKWTGKEKMKVIANGFLKKAKQGVSDRESGKAVLVRYLYSLRYFQLEKDIQDCQGCFGCWVNKVGECVKQDQVSEISKSVVNSKLFVMITPLQFGCYSVLMKRFMDRFIPNVQPFFHFHKGKVVHTKRYRDFPKMVVIAIEKGETKEEKETFCELMAANALNLNIDNPDVYFCIEKCEMIEILSKREKGKR